MYRCNEEDSYHHECYCDPLCITYRDCCTDYITQCKRELVGDPLPPEDASFGLQSGMHGAGLEPELDSGPSRMKRHGLELMPDKGGDDGENNNDGNSNVTATDAPEERHEEPPLLTCQPVHGGGVDTHLMVADCPVNVTLHQESCEKPVTKLDSTSLKYITPVIFRSILYRNVYCLRCNEGNDPAIVNAKIQPPTFLCTGEDAWSAETLYNQIGMSAEYVDYLIENCTMSMHQPEMRLISARTGCRNVRPASEGCYNINNTHYDALSLTCATYGSVINGTRPLEENTTCAVCTDLDWIKLESCMLDVSLSHKGRGGLAPAGPDGGPNGGPIVANSFSVLLDFSDDESGSHIPEIPHCGPTQYRDVIRDACVERHACDEGHAMVDGDCLYINASSTVPIVTIHGYNRIHVTF